MKYNATVLTAAALHFLAAPLYGEVDISDCATSCNGARCDGATPDYVTCCWCGAHGDPRSMGCVGEANIGDADPDYPGRYGANICSTSYPPPDYLQGAQLCQDAKFDLQGRSRGFYYQEVHEPVSQDNTVYAYTSCLWVPADDAGDEGLNGQCMSPDEFSHEFSTYPTLYAPDGIEISLSCESIGQ